MKTGTNITNWFRSQCKRPQFLWGLSILWLCLIGWLAFFWNLGDIGLIDETEPLFAEAARQMTVTGDWITPYFNNATRFDKPPLIYWLMAIGYQVLGVNMWAVRLPSALAAFALTCLGFYTLLHWGKPENSRQPDDLTSDFSPSPPKSWLAAWIGAAMIALNPETIAWGRIGVSDMLLTGCMGSALLTFFIGYVCQGKEAGKNEETRDDHPEKNNLKVGIFNPITNGWYLAFYILIALAVLTKGPVGMVLPFMIIAAFLVYVNQWREVWREIFPLRGTLIFLGITLPWYILVTLANGENYINTFFGYHNLERFTQVVNHHAAPWYFYVPVIFAGFAPWSFYLPLAISQTEFWRRRYWQRQPRTNHLGLFAFFWFVCIFGFFTIAVTKLPSYVLPLMPAAAILVALLWCNLLRQGHRNFAATTQKLAVAEITPQFSSLKRPQSSVFLKATIVVNSLVLLVLGITIFYSFHWLGGDPAMPNFPQVIQSSGLLIWGSIIWIVTAVVIALLLGLQQTHWIWTVNFLGILAFIIFTVTPTFMLVDQQRQLPLRHLSETIVQVREPGEEIVMISFEKPSVVFYTKQPVAFFRRATEARIYLKKLAATQPNPPSVLILGYPKKFPHTGLQNNQYQILDHAGAYQLARVPKQALLQGGSPILNEENE